MNTYTLRRVAKCLLAFNSRCGATARVTKHLPAYYRYFRTSTDETTTVVSKYLRTRLLLSLRSLNGGCQTCTSLQRSLLDLIFETIPLIVHTPPLSKLRIQTHKRTFVQKIRLIMVIASAVIMLVWLILAYTQRRKKKEVRR